MPRPGARGVVHTTGRLPLCCSATVPFLCNHGAQDLDELQAYLLLLRVSKTARLGPIGPHLILDQLATLLVAYCTERTCLLQITQDLLEIGGEACSGTGCAGGQAVLGGPAGDPPFLGQPHHPLPLLPLQSETGGSKELDGFLQSVAAGVEAAAVTALLAALEGRGMPTPAPPLDAVAAAHRVQELISLLSILMLIYYFPRFGIVMLVSGFA